LKLDRRGKAAATIGSKREFSEIAFRLGRHGIRHSHTDSIATVPAAILGRILLGEMSDIQINRVATGSGVLIYRVYGNGRRLLFMLEKNRQPFSSFSKIVFL
jgi:hypothetical protein